MIPSWYIFMNFKSSIAMLAACCKLAHSKNDVIFLMKYEFWCLQTMRTADAFVYFRYRLMQSWLRQMVNITFIRQRLNIECVFVRLCVCVYVLVCLCICMLVCVCVLLYMNGSFLKNKLLCDFSFLIPFKSVEPTATNMTIPFKRKEVGSILIFLISKFKRSKVAHKYFLTASYLVLNMETPKLNCVSFSRILQHFLEERNYHIQTITT